MGRSRAATSANMESKSLCSMVTRRKVDEAELLVMKQKQTENKIVM